MRRRRWFALAAVLATVVALLGWRTFRPRPRPFNVVVVLADTLRADHLGAYGYHRSTSPNLDRFFAEGAVFHGARSQSSCTYPSVNSLLTSRYPAPFLDQPEKRMGIPDGMPTLVHNVQTLAAVPTGSVTCSCRSCCTRSMRPKPVSST